MFLWLIPIAGGVFFLFVLSMEGTVGTLRGTALLLLKAAARLEYKRERRNRALRLQLRQVLQRRTEDDRRKEANNHAGNS